MSNSDINRHLKDVILHSKKLILQLKDGSIEEIDESFRLIEGTVDKAKLEVVRTYRHRLK